MGGESRCSGGTSASSRHSRSRSSRWRSQCDCRPTRRKEYVENLDPLIEDPVADEPLTRSV
jgi:hypothetical protein